MNSTLVQVAEPAEAAPAPGPLRPFDVRLRREIAHRRLVISMMRRFLRVVGLHTLDAALLGGVLLVLASLWAPFGGMGEYALAIIAITLLSLNAMSAYRPGSGRRDHGRLISGLAMSTLILACLVVFPPRLDVTPLAMLAFGAAAFVMLAAGRADARVTAEDETQRLFDDVEAHQYGIYQATVLKDHDPAVRPQHHTGQFRREHERYEQAFEA